MNVITFSGNLSSVDKSTSAAKTNSVLHQETQAPLPASKLTIPDSALLKVYFTGEYQYPNEYKENPSTYNDVIEGKITNEDIKSDADLSGKNLKEYNFAENGKTDIGGIKLRQTILSKAIFEGIKISDEQNQTDLTDANCTEITINNSDLKYAKALRTKFIKVKFNNDDLSNSDFRGGKFDVAEFNDETNLDNADFRDSWILNADFRGSKNIDTAKFDGAYYSLGTKFPENYKPDYSKMILVADDQSIRYEKVQVYFKTIESLI